MAEAKKDDRMRVRLAIPPADTQVIQWVNLQSNISNSIRKLIRESIARDGMVDVDCKQVKPGVRPGRPRKTADPVSDYKTVGGEIVSSAIARLEKGGGSDG